MINISTCKKNAENYLQSLTSIFNFIIIFAISNVGIVSVPAIMVVPAIM